MNQESGFKDTEKEITVTDSQVCLKEQRYSIKDVSVVSVSDKNKPLWPGVVLSIWAGLVFYNDSLPRTIGVEPNNPLFKWVIVFAAVAYFFWWVKQPTKHEVKITVNGEEESVAVYDDRSQADMLADAISAKLKS